MASIISTSGLGLLDLPAEIRLRIYEFAIPEEIVVQTWDYNREINDRVYSMQLADHERPKFIFTSKLIQQEATPMFWDRVTLDHSYLTAKGRSAITTSDSGAEESHLPTIKVFESNADSIRKVRISTQAENITERVWPCKFSSLHSIDIIYLPADVPDRDLQRIYVRARAAKASKALTSTMGDYFRELVIASEFSSMIATDLPSILAENKYQVSISLLPIDVYQRWSVDHWTGVLNEFRHEATALLQYDCNTDSMTCELADVKTCMIHFQDTVLPENVVRSRDIDKTEVRQMYRVPEEIVRVRNMDLLERLICREIENRGMVPPLSASRRRPGHI